MELLQRDINSITSPAAPSDIDARALGHAYGLSALIATIPDQPLYVSYDISVKVLDMATQLLKRAAEHDVKVAGVEVEVAWAMMASLMALGPNFVRAHLPQLLVLWRNALPKHTTKDSMGRGVAEWMFLLHVRESALGAVLSFLRHNSSLVTLDVARRISSLLVNALSFANMFISQNVEELPETGSSKSMSLKVRETLLRRRVYQCFTTLGFLSIAESTQASLIQSTVSLFASPEGYVGSSVQAAIASSSGSFITVWQSTDAYAYGLTGLEVEDHGTASARFNRDTIENHINETASASFPLHVLVLKFRLSSSECQF
jgi:HEAT repeat-containing protein 5